MLKSILPKYWQCQVNNAFKQRKLLYQSTSPQIPIKGSVYCGFDPTAYSLHLGNFISILNLVRLAQLGFQPIAIVGGATVQLGDPSFKNEERDQPNLDIINNNLNLITTQLNFVYSNITNHLNCQIPQLQILNNMEFYKEMNLIEFISKVGRKFRMNQLLNKDHIKKRVDSEEGLSLTEFFYTILQSYDFAYLNQKYNCTLQIGGSDQWGNITNGCDFVRKEFKNQVFGLTTPLLVDKNGQKFGKSEGNALYLDIKCKHDIKQYILNIDDESIENFLYMLTFLDENQIKSILNQHKQQPELRIGQNTLANELLSMIYGINKQYNNKLLYDLKLNQINTMQPNDFEQLIEQIDPDIILKVNKDTHLMDILLKFKSSKSEIKRLIQQGGLMINDIKIQSLEQAKLLHDKYMIVKMGKREVRLLIFI